jgi:HAD superfamily hydrolase (TIGR01549 family)
MTLTLLLDLDDTLLDNEMGEFIPAYLQALGDHLKSIVPPEQLIPAYLEATQRMLENKSPDRTLHQVFEAVLYPQLSLEPATLQEPIADFYENEFPKLRRLTKFRPEAVEMVEESLRRGYELVLATNSLFPRTAVVQRLEWAGLAADRIPFRVIPSYEAFSFAKPNPAFFAELLGNLGWPDGPVLMVGDDHANDIKPAQTFGLSTFWITEQAESESITYPNAHGRGKLPDLLSWIDSSAPDDLFLNFEQPESLLSILRSTPAIFNTYTVDLYPADWLTEPRPGEWSLTEIICHLRDVDSDVNLPRLRKILDGSNPFLPGIDTDQWAEERLYYCQDGLSARNDFTGNRIELVNILGSLDLADWELAARHAIFGPTHLKELVGIIAGHDRLHVRQAYQTLGEIAEIPAS